MWIVTLSREPVTFTGLHPDKVAEFGLALGEVVREGDPGTETGGINGRGGRNKFTPASRSCVGVQCPS